ncbi:hypothetical protein [Mucilaginibacter ginkgonis]|uniref:PH (Pleckstrin Homology) domain-containing protein n=1 Tax=Mucilaginibacter ginkgonis TaxID=2682091 RepID=A0A6I4HVD5_9SPHI|nr:hypothetical protein [Mucilaginibacter ginkgonis]QQL49832.1 hypothetical protein GO620_016955 [Mucilaginibacter ginkgonis]
MKRKPEDERLHENEEIIGADYTVILQWIILVGSTLFSLFTGYILRDTPFSGNLFLIIFCVLVFFIVCIWRLFSFADVSISSTHIIYRKMTGTQRRLLTDIKSIESGITIGNYYMEFIDGYKVYFRLKNSEFLSTFFSNDAPATLERLRRKLKVIEI